MPRHRGKVSLSVLFPSTKAILTILAMASTLTWRASRIVTPVYGWISAPHRQWQVHRTIITTSLKTLPRTTIKDPESNGETEENNDSTLDDSEQKRVDRALQKRNSKKKARDRRKEFIGLPKAVDRGQYSVTYQPGGVNGETFEAKSGIPDLTKPFTVLGIESSCDDTGAAIVRSDGVILGEALASQAQIHEEWGGVVPSLAKTAHEENIDGVINLALKNANMTMQDIDAIGATVGPGLEVCLRVGCNRARQLAVEYNTPFVAVHHLEAHILMTRLDRPDLQFPFLALLVSGGHCQLLKCLGIGRYSIIGGTLDDSLGEAYDKTARLLQLPVGGGGGPAVEELAKEGNATSIPLTVPLQRRNDCDFSYAGLKTSVRRAAECLAADRGLASTDELSRQDRANLAASFQHIAIKHLEQRLVRAMTLVEGDIKTLAVVGGVAANMELRRRLDALCEDRQWNMVVPPPRLCTDQGAMSAWAAVERLRVGSSDDPSNQEVYARFPFAHIVSDA